MDYKPDNRAKKVEGRKKRRGFMQGKRSYLHAMINSIVRRADKKPKKK